MIPVPLGRFLLDDRDSFSLSCSTNNAAKSSLVNPIKHKHIKNDTGKICIWQKNYCNLKDINDEARNRKQENNVSKILILWTGSITHASIFTCWGRLGGVGHNGTIAYGSINSKVLTSAIM